MSAKDRPTTKAGPKERPVGEQQRRVLRMLSAAGAYLRRQRYNGYLRTWLAHEGSRPRSLPPRFRNALVDSLSSRGFISLLPDETPADLRGAGEGRWAITDAGRRYAKDA